MEAGGGPQPDPAGFKRLWKKMKRECKNGGHQ